MEQLTKEDGAVGERWRMEWNNKKSLLLLLEHFYGTLNWNF
jgi:hypothetical protein